MAPPSTQASAQTNPHTNGTNNNHHHQHHHDDRSPPLNRLELYNFKSYKGRVILGPFHSFTAVIGPNGAGKSNLMDAISFVLGVRSSSLRSSALKDLIYRSGGSRKGKERGEVDDEDGEEEEEEEGEEGGAGEDDEGRVDGERKAWVQAVYIDTKGKEWKFKRTIARSGISEYHLNGKKVKYDQYNDTLESFNILVKAKNFLVFQGDVEQVASQSPKDLAVLIDRISGSGDYKEAYEAAAKDLERATETSVAQHARRKGVNGEIKQYKEMKKEAERWKSLMQKKDDAVVHHLLWKLFHIAEGIKTNTSEIDEKNARLSTLRADHAEFEEQQKLAKKDHSKAQKEFSKQEKQVLRASKELEERRPELVAIEARIAHARKKLIAAETNAEKVQVDLRAGEVKLASLEEDLQLVQSAADRAAQEQAQQARARGIDLSQADIDDYHRLKNQAAVLAVAEREALVGVQRDLKGRNANLVVQRDSVEVAQRKRDKLETEQEGLNAKKAAIDAKVKEAQANLNRANNDLEELRARKRQTTQTETELNEKLLDALNKLQQAGAEKQESERDAKFKETLSALKRTFPGIKGRVIDLCKPTQNKYSLAVTTILGRNIDSIVVDSERTAIQCIEYMRVQRAGQATFIPLETITAKPANDKYRNFARGARLAIDVITFDTSVERAMQFACGNALVCDTINVAKHVVYEMGQEVKAVSLDGTVIHRSGLITGGASSNSNGRHFEDREIEALRRKEAELRGKLSEILKNKPRANVEEELISQTQIYTSELANLRDDLSSINARLKDTSSELKVIKTTLKDLNGKVSQLERDIDSLSSKAKDLEATIASAEEGIFRAFCRRIGVSSIRDYEEQQLGVAQAANEANLKFKTQIARLNNAIKFEKERVETTRKRLDSLRNMAVQSRTSLGTLQEEKEALENELKTLEKGNEGLRETLSALEAVLREKSERLDEVRREGNKSYKVVEKTLKEIANCNDEIERLSSERFAIYRKCKLEEIDLPLVKGKLNAVPIDEALPPAAPMDIEGDEDETQAVVTTNDYGIVPDYDELEDDEREDGSNEMGEALSQAIVDLETEMDKMSPNLKAIEKLGDSEARFRQIDAEFDQAREEARKAKEAFSDLKKKRCKLFNAAYEHISGSIDKVYKDLTKGRAAPMGGVAYLSLEDSEEPYLHGIKYHAMPPMKRFRDMDQLSGGEKTMAALALLFAIHSFHPSPFFVLDEVDAALDNTNVQRVARYVQSIASPDFQFIVISLKPAFFEQAAALVGVYRQGGGSKNLTLDVPIELIVSISPIFVQLTQYSD
ncbi:BZ3500_MvSof-1268-A1-R1_Chr3-1g05436 [Microbotryum saponariae]|uniref:Structural maintenance of chromosomes protein n=1 Tax=Microbotryum saponariae TaxID=289078 RepID=A0A2X0KZI4_9BASI|nr:BZ3500_MvSof-1268-A1-R1_Chr3-1g05436 [Microbotryum saponariae]SDA04627.1 BZ3501_MvSof-1269-A2-R1_Chr3-1g05107 [Microbotryum saponariae]